MFNNLTYIEEPFLPKQIHEHDLVPYYTRRISDSTAVEDNHFDFVLLILVNVQSIMIYRCSGSLVTERWVLTAAHCLTQPNLKPKDILLVGGNPNLYNYLEKRQWEVIEDDLETELGVEERRASFYAIHPHFDEGGAPSDLGLIKLQYSYSSIEPVKLNLLEITEPKHNCVVVGWGALSTNLFDGRLRYRANLLVTTPKIGCKEKKTGPYLCFNYQIPELCVGDAGSPLLCDGRICGIASYFGHIKGLNIFDSLCVNSTSFYYNALYNANRWITALTSESNEKHIAFISWKKLLIFILLWAFFERL